VERQYNDGSNNEESTGMGMDNTSKYDGGQRKRKWIERRYGHRTNELDWIVVKKTGEPTIGYWDQFSDLRGCSVVQSLVFLRSWGKNAFFARERVESRILGWSFVARRGARFNLAPLGMPAVI